MVLNDGGVNRPHLFSSKAAEIWKTENSSGLDEGAFAKILQN
jgi:hypothetical protein